MHRNETCVLLFVSPVHLLSINKKKTQTKYYTRKWYWVNTFYLTIKLGTFRHVFNVVARPHLNQSQAESRAILL